MSTDELDFYLLQDMMAKGFVSINDTASVGDTRIVDSVVESLNDQYQRVYLHTGRFFDEILTKGLLEDITTSIMIRPDIAHSLPMMGACTAKLDLDPVLRVGVHSIASSFDNEALHTIIALASQLVIRVYSKLHKHSDASNLRLLFGSLVHFDSSRTSLLFAFGFDHGIYNYNTQSCMPVLLATLATATEEYQKQESKNGVPFPVHIRQHLAVVTEDMMKHDYNPQHLLSPDANAAVEEYQSSITEVILDNYVPQYPDDVTITSKGSQPWHNDTLTGSDVAPNASLLVVVNITAEPIKSTQVAVCEFVDSSGQRRYHPWLVYMHGPVPTRLPLTSSRVLSLDPIPPGGFAILSPALVHRGAA
jgi:hypothetical protein